MDPRGISLRTGGLPGAAVAVAAALCMLAANRRTINPASAAVLVLWWTLAGAVIGTAAGWLGGRATAAFRRPFELGAQPFAALLVGHLLLPAGFGAAIAAGTLILLLLRRRFLPRAGRLDLTFAIGLAALAPPFVEVMDPGLPPPLPPDAPLAENSPARGSVPVTVSVHTEPGFPEVPAVHVTLRPLDSEAPGVRASLWSGRVPARTRAGRGEQILLPGGGGLSRLLDAPGIPFLLAPFPRPANASEPPFAITGSLPALARASGIPVLTGLPAPDDPPHFLRILDADQAPDLEVAHELRSQGAWIDVSLDEDGGGRLALSGMGFALGHAGGRANLMDITPTALHLLGLAIPRSCDGRVLAEVMDPDGPAIRPLRYRALGRPPDASASTTPR